ncbi:MAG: hypothetical protein U0359_21665 [Byssovorax sp.]
MNATDPFSADGARHLEVSLTRKGRIFRGRLAFMDGDGHAAEPREMSGATCGALVDSMAISVSIALRPFVSQPASPDPVVVSTPPSAADSAKAPPLEQPSLMFRVGAGAALGLGVSPAGAAPGVTVDAGLRWVRWAPLSLSLEGRAYPVASGAAESGVARVASGLFTGALVPCLHVHLIDHLALAGCMLMELGALRVTSDAPHPVPAVFLHAATGLRVGIEVPLIDHLALRATGDALFTLRPARALVYGVPAWETPLVSASFGLGAVASFW